MDLNLLYSQHQHALMRAKSSTNKICRTRHLARAGSFAWRIRTWQLSEGAAAAGSWLDSVDDTDFPERISA